MKEINIASGNYLFVEVPDDAGDFKFIHNNIRIAYFIPIYKRFDLPNKTFWKIISTTKDITEEQAGIIVANHIYQYAHKNGGDFIGYLDYEYSEKYPEEALFDYMTAKESLQSLIKANGLDINKNYLILLSL